jgi:hypothetical protein
MPASQAERNRFTRHDVSVVLASRMIECRSLRPLPHRLTRAILRPRAVLIRNGPEFEDEAHARDHARNDY